MNSIPPVAGDCHSWSVRRTSFLQVVISCKSPFLASRDILQVSLPYVSPFHASLPSLQVILPWKLPASVHPFYDAYIILIYITRKRNQYNARGRESYTGRLPTVIYTVLSILEGLSNFLRVQSTRRLHADYMASCGVVLTYAATCSRTRQPAHVRGRCLMRLVEWPRGRISRIAMC